MGNLKQWDSVFVSFCGSTEREVVSYLWFIYFMVKKTKMSECSRVERVQKSLLKGERLFAFSLFFSKLILAKSGGDPRTKGADFRPS